jgi:hypothetical protein
VTPLRLTRRLTAIAESTPTFIAGTYSLYSRRQLAEAIIDAWIVIEQVVDCAWSSYIDELDDRMRRERLRDNRTYTAAVRIELLHTKRLIPPALYEAMNLARKQATPLCIVRE